MTPDKETLPANGVAAGAPGSLPFSPPFSAVDDALAYADAGDRNIDDPLTILATEVRALRNSVGIEALAIVRGLRAENVALRADKARIDWLLDFNQKAMGVVDDRTEDWIYTRDAIDDAMREANGSDEGRRNE